MSVGTERAFDPPQPSGEPFRGDPNDPPPFLTESDRVPVVPVESGVPFGSPPSYSQQPPSISVPDPNQPVFQAPAPRALTPDERYAQTAFRVGVASIFIFNIILGPIAVFMGIGAIRRGQSKHGKQAIIFGAIGTLLGITLFVLAATGVLDEAMDRLREASK